MLRRLALRYDMRYMWSLTFGELAPTELEEAWALWERFRRRARRAGVLPRAWVVVPELQKRGVWHFHVITNEFVAYEKVRDLWGYGFISMTAGSAAGGGGYVAKYMTKSFGEGDARPEGVHRYRRSSGLELPEVEVWELDPEEVEHGAMAAIQSRGGGRLVGQAFVPEAGLWWALVAKESAPGGKRPSTWKNRVGEGPDPPRRC